MKCETPIYKGFARGVPSQDTHQDSHPDTHQPGESEAHSKSSVVQVTNWVTVLVSIWVSIYYCKILYLSAFQMDWVSMVSGVLLPVFIFFA